MRQLPRERKDIMLCYPYSEKRLLKYPKPWIVQPKLNGDRCRAIFDPELGWQLVSSTGLPRDFIHIKVDLFEIFGYDYPTTCELDGELYIHGLPHEELRSRISPTKNKHPKANELEYHIFDLINETKSQMNRYVDLLSYGQAANSIVFVPVHEVRELDELELLYDHYLMEGYEGIIIRDPTAPYKRKRNTQIMKLKPRDELKAIVVNIIEEKDMAENPKGTLGAVKCTRDNKTFFEVGSGFTKEERKMYWDNPDLIIGKIIEFAYSEISIYGIPKMTSFKRIAGEYET